MDGVTANNSRSVTSGFLAKPMWQCESTNVGFVESTMSHAQRDGNSLVTRAEAAAGSPFAQPLVATLTRCSV